MNNDERIISETKSDGENPVLPETHVENDILEEILRSQSQRKMELVSEIEEHANRLESTIQKKIEIFLQQPIKHTFREMAMFKLASISENLSDKSFLLFEGDEHPVVCFYFDNNLFQKLLVIAITGDAEAQEGKRPLSGGEKSLMQVFTNLLGMGFFEGTDIISKFGIPKKPVIGNPNQFDEYDQKTEFVSFRFDLSVAGIEDSYLLIAPLSAYDDPKKTGWNQKSDSELREELIWKEMLFDRIQDLSVPLKIELGSADLLLADVNNLAPGQTLQLSVQSEGLKVFAEDGALLMTGGLQIEGDKINFKVSSTADLKG